MTTKPITILFDLDGTLAATAPDITDAVNAVLAEQGWPALREEQAYGFIATGAAAEELIRHSLGDTADRLSADEKRRLLQRYFEIYGENLCVRTKLFDGCAGCLADLAAAGHVLAVCTNKPTAFAQRLLETLGIAGHFAAICGRDRFDAHKPDPRHVWSTIEEVGGDRRAAMLIGDSIVDWQSARAAGIPVILMSSGYSSQSLDSLGPDALVDHFDDLGAAIGMVARSL